MKNQIHTSEDILAMEYPYFEEIKYRLTEGELQWLSFIANKYAIHDYLMKHIEEDIVSINFYEASMCLDMDCNQAGKAVCLSDETALQKLFFFNYVEKE